MSIHLSPARLRRLRETGHTEKIVAFGLQLIARLAYWRAYEQATVGLTTRLDPIGLVDEIQTVLLALDRTPGFEALLHHLERRYVGALEATDPILAEVYRPIMDCFFTTEVTRADLAERWTGLANRVTGRIFDDIVTGDDTAAGGTEDAKDIAAVGDCWGTAMAAACAQGVSLSGSTDEPADDPAVPAKAEIAAALGYTAQVDPTESYIAYRIEKTFDALNLRFDVFRVDHEQMGAQAEPAVNEYLRATIMDLATLLATVPAHMRTEVGVRLTAHCKRLPSTIATEHARDCLAIAFWCDVAELYVETLAITAGRKVGRESEADLIAFCRNINAERNEMLKLTRSCRETCIRAAAGGVVRAEDTRSGQIPDALTRPTAVAPPRRSLRDLDPTTDVLTLSNGHLCDGVHPLNPDDFGDGVHPLNPDDFGSGLSGVATVQPVNANAIARIDETRAQGRPTWHPLPGKRHVIRTGRVTARLWRATCDGHPLLTDGCYAWTPDGRCLGHSLSDLKVFVPTTSHWTAYDLVGVYEADVVREPMVRDLHTGRPIDPPSLEC